MRVKIYECKFEKLTFVKEFSLVGFVIPKLKEFIMFGTYSYSVKQITYDYDNGIISIVVIEQSLDYSK